MARIIRLDTAITDMSAPRMAHSAGVAGYISRYLGAYAPAAVGGTVTTLADNTGPNHLSVVKSPSTEIRLRDDARGFKYLQMANTGTVNGTASLATTGNPAGAAFTVALVIKDPGIPAPVAGAGGAFFQRAGNGQWQFRNATGGAGNILIGGTSTAEWSLLIGTVNGADSSLNANGVTINGPLPTPGGPTFIGPQHSGGNTGTSFAELILWPRALSAGEVSTVRAALKERYPFLP